MVDELAIVKAVVEERRKMREEDERAAAQAPRGVELPQRPPSGGHRGPVYCGDLYEILRRAAWRPDFRVVYNQRSKAWNKRHLCTLYTGDPDPRRDIPRQGPLMNMKTGMVPEWTLMERANDPESEVYCWGWREIVLRCLRRKLIKPTQEVIDLVGMSNF